MRILDVRFPLPKPLHFAQPIQDDRRRDGVQPGRECGFAPKRVEPVERADERLLREVLRECIISGEPVGQAVHAVHVGVVQRPLGGAIPGADAGN